MFKTILLIIIIVIFNGCSKNTAKTSDTVKIASIADIHASISSDINNSAGNRIRYQPFHSFVNDSSIHIIVGYLFSSTGSSKYTLRIIYFNGNSDIYRDISKELMNQYKIGYIYSEDMLKLDDIFLKYDFCNYPDYLPTSQKGHTQWPSSSFEICYRGEPSETMKRVSVDRTVSGNYPDTFFKFLYELDKGIQLYQ
jgi:hypothetical protein